MEQDFLAKVRRKKLHRIIAIVLLAAACVIIAATIRITGRGDPGAAAKADRSPDAAGAVTASIEIRCDQLTGQPDAVSDPALKGYIPEDGIILAEQTVPVEPGKTSVFDITDQVCREQDIQIEYSYTPGYNSHYIEGINYLYEFTAGKYSGWIFRVNGEQPNYGADQVILEGGEKIVWEYTVDYRTEKEGEYDYE